VTTDSPNTPRSRRRIDGVDLLRGLAIFFVLMNHLNMRLLSADVPYTKGLPEQLVSSLVWNGQPGVQIFFAVSGFLITATTLRRWGALCRVNLRGFYLMRFARIVPLLLLLLSVLSILDLVQVKHSQQISISVFSCGDAIYSQALVGAMPSTS
jgi:peptidoglycan/LPS O-acetylase OafA/YrhL